MPSADFKTLASTVKPGEVVIYGTDGCPACAEAKGWLNQNGFAYTYCNLDTSERCMREYSAFGGRFIPLLVVRGHPMMNGFETAEFLTALREKS